MSDEELWRPLGQAIQEFANASLDQPGIVTQAVVIFEVMSVSDEGQSQEQIQYTVPTDNFSMSGALGLVEAGRYYIRRDILHDEEP